MSLPDDITPRQVASITILEFMVDHEEERDAKGTKIPGTAKEFHKVRWAPRGTNKSENIQRVDRIRKHEPILWAAIEKAYERWLKGQAEPVEGTPLSAWAGVNKAQAEQLRLLGILSVEHAAEMNGTTMQSFGMGAVGIKQRAQAFLASKPQAQMVEALAQKDEQIKALTEQLAELTRTVNALAAEPEAPRRGRPPKQAEAA